MKILSVYPYTHISSSALLINGKIISAAAEERFNREKMSIKFPIKSANWCLEKNNITWKDLDAIVVPWNPQINISNSSSRWTSNISWRGEMLSVVPAILMREMQLPNNEFMKIQWGENNLYFVNHHLAHAAFGFYQSNFNSSDILTIDGHGEKETCFLGYGVKNKITQIASINYPHSLGLFYGTITDFLGFKPDSDEWKVMAMASYAKGTSFDKKIKKLYRLTKNGFELDLRYFNYYKFDREKYFFSEKFISEFGKPRKKNDKYNKFYFEIAGALQRNFEIIAKHLIKILKSKSPLNSKNIVLSGGAAMNSVFNGKLDYIKNYKNSYIGHAPDDSGVSIGSALYLYHHVLNKKRITNKEIETNYLGPNYSNQYILKILNNNKLKYKKISNVEKLIAREIKSGKIIGHFYGAMEFGHRALGNRSILADPRLKNNKDRVNKLIKFRENFRPFAPATLNKFVNDIFNIPTNRKVNFMERVYPIKKKWRKKIPAVTHVDGSGRIQTVFKENNLRFYKIINEFYNITGVPVLLNTSFNLNGEPVVMTPEDALRTFYSCGLDILVLNDYVIYK